MKCFSCQMEWIDNGKFSNVEKCPFCGESLIKDVVKPEEATMGSTLRYIRNKYGDAVFTDKTKLYSLFKDLAPQLRKELVTLQIAMDLNIDKYFIGVSEEKRNDSLYAFKQKTEEHLKSFVTDVVPAFSEAFGWDTYEFENVSYANSYEDNEEITSPIVNEDYDTDELSFEFEGTKLIKYKGKKELVVVPEKTEVIGEKAFSNTKIKDVLLPDSLIRIKESAFEKCSKLCKVIIPNKVTEIGKNAFKDCKLLEEIIISSGCKSIEQSVFENCIKLKRIEISDGLDNIGANCFRGCTGLVEVVFSHNNKCEEIGYGTFENCASLEKIVFPEGLKRIGNWCFDGCKKLKAIKIPSELQEIGPDAFNQCTSLERIEYDENHSMVTQLTLSVLTLSGCDNLIINYDNNEFEIEGHKIIKYNGEEKNVIIPLGIKTIGTEAFANKNIEGILISSTVSIIESKAFYNCNKLKTINLPIGLKEIESSAFEECKSLSYIDNIDSVGKVEYSAFYHSGIKNLILNPFNDVYKLGDEVEFGNYNGIRIKWIVFEKKDGLIRIVSTASICKRSFDEKKNIWNKSGLREWLNGEFYNSAFSLEEQALVRLNVDDTVTILSREELNLDVPGLTEPDDYDSFWLRSKSSNSTKTCEVFSAMTGEVKDCIVTELNGVRPVVNISLKRLYGDY